MSNSKLFTVVSMYMVGIQAGIQTAHLVHKLFTKYDSATGLHVAPSAGKLLHEWAEKDQTLVVLRGGGHQSLGRTYKKLSTLALALDLPHTQWHESKNALNGALTCIGVVVPQEYWAYNKPVANQWSEPPLAPDEKVICDLNELLASFPKAS